MNNPIGSWIRKRRTARGNRILYGRSASALLLWYLLAMVGIVLGTFLLFFVGYNFYKMLQDSFLYSYIDFVTPFVVIPLYNLMLGVRDIALLVVILVVGAGWLGTTWAFFRLYQRDITKVVQAAGTLMDPDAASPQLPDVLAPADPDTGASHQ